MGQIAKNFRGGFRTKFRRGYCQGFPNLRSTREAVCALRQFSEECQPEWLLWSKRSCPLKLPLSKTQVSRKVAGWRSHIDALEFLSEFTVHQGSDQAQLSWDDVFKHPRTCGIDRMSNQIGKNTFLRIFLLVFSVG